MLVRSMARRCLRLRSPAKSSSNTPSRSRKARTHSAKPACGGPGRPQSKHIFLRGIVPLCTTSLGWALWLYLTPMAEL
jgi:hypothetical protein